MKRFGPLDTFFDCHLRQNELDRWGPCSTVLYKINGRGISEARPSFNEHVIGRVGEGISHVLACVYNASGHLSLSGHLSVQKFRTI